jgi:RNA polymerase sigma-70 factor (TIGR02943 family)
MSVTSHSDSHGAISSWLVKYGDEMYSWAHYKTSSKETAEDLVQETMISAYKSFDKFNPDTNPKTWLFTILNNKIIDYYRASNTKKSFNESELLGRFSEDDNFSNDGHFTKVQEPLWGNTEQSLLDNEEFNAVLASCIDKLPTNWKIVIISKYVHNKKGSLICKELGITSSNLWQMAHRAKLQLKSCLDLNWKID